MPKIYYTDVLLEEMRDQLQTVFEIVSGMRTELDQVPKRDEFEVLKQEVRTIRIVLTDTCAQVKDHERRIVKLETAQ